MCVHVWLICMTSVASTGGQISVEINYYILVFESCHVDHPLFKAHFPTSQWTARKHWCLIGCVMVDKYTESKDVGRENPTAGGLSCQTYTTLEEITSFRDDLVPVELNDTKTGRKRNKCPIRGMQVKTWKQRTVPLFIFYKINRLYEMKWKQTRRCSM